MSTARKFTPVDPVYLGMKERVLDGKDREELERIVDLYLAWKADAEGVEYLSEKEFLIAMDTFVTGVRESVEEQIAEDRGGA